MRAAPPRAGRGHALQVAAGAEGAAGAGEDHRAHAVVGGGRLQRIERAGEQVRAHGIHGLRPLQRDGGDSVLDLVVDGAHGMWPYSVFDRRAGAGARIGPNQSRATRPCGRSVKAWARSSAAERRISLEALDERAARAAAGLKSLGVGRGDLIAIYLRNDFPFFEASFAAGLHRRLSDAR